MKKIFFIHSLLFCLAFSSANGQNNKKLNVLFLGNSYTYVNNLPQLIQNIALANGDTLVFDSNCPGGYTLNDHFTNATSISKINAKAWNYVVLQAQSQEPSFSPGQVAAQTLPYAIKLDSVINHNDSCTKTVFFETWGRKNGDASNCPFYPPVCTYLGMQQRLKESYKLFADTCHAIMSPAGEAWRMSIGLDSSLNLYQGDASHPSLAGSYLTACVFYEVLFRKSVLNSTYTAGINTSIADFLQQVAHDVVNDSINVWNIGKYNPCTSIGMPDILIEEKIKIFPNPANNILNISYPAKWNKKLVTYQIIDILGRVYVQNQLISKSISVSMLPAGLYFIKIKTERKTHTVKFNKQ